MTRYYRPGGLVPGAESPPFFLADRPFTWTQVYNPAGALPYIGRDGHVFSDGRLLFLTTGGGTSTDYRAVRSSDGVTWAESVFPAPPSSLSSDWGEMSVLLGDVAYAAYGGGTAGLGFAVYVSLDGGATWTKRYGANFGGIAGNTARVYLLKPGGILHVVMKSETSVIARVYQDTGTGFVQIGADSGAGTVGGQPCVAYSPLWGDIFVGIGTGLKRFNVATQTWVNAWTFAQAIQGMTYFPSVKRLVVYTQSSGTWTFDERPDGVVAPILRNNFMFNGFRYRVVSNNAFLTAQVPVGTTHIWRTPDGITFQELGTIGYASGVPIVFRPQDGRFYFQASANSGVDVFRSQVFS